MCALCRDQRSKNNFIIITENSSDDFAKYYELRHKMKLRYVKTQCQCCKRFCPFDMRVIKWTEDHSQSFERITIVEHGAGFKEPLYLCTPCVDLYDCIISDELLNAL